MITAQPPVSPLQTAIELRAVVGRLLRGFREAGADDALTPTQASALMRLGKGGVSTVSTLAAAEKAHALRSDDLFINTTLSRIWMERGDKARAEHFGAQAKIQSWKEQLKNPSEK